MTIQYASDLHLEFDRNYKWLKKNPLIPTGEILILAGDICYLNRYLHRTKIWEYLSENWEHVYWLTGNHEYYGGVNVHSFYQHRILHNVQVVNNVSVVHEDLEIFFTTLWSVLNPPDYGALLVAFNDFKRIHRNNRLLTPGDYEEMHKWSLSILKEKLKKSTADKKVVATHHVPSEECNPEEFKGSVFNSAYVTDLSDFIYDSDIDFWIYGHHHRNLPQVEIGGTKLITNQLGYISMGEDESFRRDAVIDLNPCEHDWEHIDHQRVQCRLCDEIQYVT